jgi:hypothetical protein
MKTNISVLNWQNNLKNKIFGKYAPTAMYAYHYEPQSSKLYLHFVNDNVIFVNGIMKKSACLSGVKNRPIVIMHFNPKKHLLLFSQIPKDFILVK